MEHAASPFARARAKAREAFSGVLRWRPGPRAAAPAASAAAAPAEPAKPTISPPPPSGADPAALILASTPPPAGPRLAFGASHWDRLPREVKDNVLLSAGPLTQLLLGWTPAATSTHDAGTRTTRHLEHELWHDAFAGDWQGDLALLPATFATWLPHTAFRAIRSRRMLARVADLARHPPDMLQYAAITNVWVDAIDLRDPNAALFKAALCGAAWLAALLVDGQCPLADVAAAARAVPRPRGDGSFSEQALAREIDTCLLLHLDAGRAVVHLRSKTRAVLKEVHSVEAAMHGHINVLAFILARHRRLTPPSTIGAVTSHSSVPWGTDVMDKAATCGHLRTVQWLHEAGARCTTRAMDSAASNGHLEVVEWLHNHRTEGATTDAMDLAATFGRLRVLVWLYTNRHEGATTAAMDGAAENGHLHVLKWIYRCTPFRCTEDALLAAAESGHVDVVAWLLQTKLCHLDLPMAIRGAERKKRSDVVATLVAAQLRAL
ncbi:hypothetical protein HK105_206451 [Polyrhizophydium stewartii]|uniref:Ankyrin repeat protein n=1 Tax=Polyrhizophydium stewartii TaxID=2732419 RepID=A0ABR4N3C6_9FUNG